MKKIYKLILYKDNLILYLVRGLILVSLMVILVKLLENIFSLYFGYLYFISSIVCLTFREFSRDQDRVLRNDTASRMDGPYKNDLVYYPENQFLQSLGLAGAILMLLAYISHYF